METSPDNLERLLRFDLVRASKLLEISQYSIVLFFLGFYAGSFIDNVLPKYDEKMSDLELFRDLILQLVMISVSAYYIKKITALIPFMFSLTSSYVPSKKGEAAFGGALAMAIIFVSVQKNFIKKIGLLHERYAINR